MIVNTPRFYYDNGHYPTPEAAIAAFRLAHQQWLDGLGQGCTHQQWLGLTVQEFSNWVRGYSLPSPNRRMKATWRVRVGSA